DHIGYKPYGVILILPENSKNPQVCYFINIMYVFCTYISAETVFICRQVLLEVFLFHPVLIMAGVIDCTRADDKHFPEIAGIPGQIKEHSGIVVKNFSRLPRIPVTRFCRSMDNNVYFIVCKVFSDTYFIN